MIETCLPAYSTKPPVMMDLLEYKDENEVFDANRAAGGLVPQRHDTSPHSMSYGFSRSQLPQVTYPFMEIAEYFNHLSVSGNDQ